MVCVKLAGTSNTENAKLNSDMVVEVPRTSTTQNIETKSSGEAFASDKNISGASYLFESNGNATNSANTTIEGKSTGKVGQGIYIASKKSIGSSNADNLSNIFKSTNSSTNVTTPTINILSGAKNVSSPTTPSKTGNATPIDSNRNIKSPTFGNTGSRAATATIKLPNYYQPKKISSLKNEIRSLQENLSTEKSTDTESKDNLTKPLLLRKKSGELVKSSLKLSLLAKSMSTSQLGSPNKSVRFASRLTNIKMFDGKDSPSVVSTNENTPLHSPKLGEDDLDELSFSPKKDYFWNWDVKEDMSSETSSEDELDYWYNTGTEGSNGSGSACTYKIESHDIPSHHPPAPVFLHSARLIEEHSLPFISGLINCQNIAFEKNLQIKLTLNNWKTNVIFSHKFFHHFKSLPLNVDQFKFKIPLKELLDNHPSKTAFSSIQLCIKYESAGNVFWDNNHNRNYHILVKKIQKPQKRSQSPQPTIKEEFPQFDELVNKLMSFQKSSTMSILGTDNNDYVLSPTKSKKSSLNARYNNINDELNEPRSSPSQLTKPEVAKSSQSFIPAIPKHIGRPGLKQSFSSSDISSTNPQKYSQSYKLKQQQISGTNINKFNSLSYTDLLANYCFSGASPQTTESPSSKVTSVLISRDVPSPLRSSCASPTPASTFYSMSDSIHI